MNLEKLLRQPTDSENDYFKKNPHVGGMATSDSRVILNPFSPLSPEEKYAVAVNESARLHMRKSGSPKFELTPQQAESLKGTAYESNPIAARETIAARILSGDPSAGAPTKDQLDFVQKLRSSMFK